MNRRILFGYAVLICTATVAGRAVAAPNARRDAELLRACALGDDARAAKLLKAGANPNCADQQGATPLIRAVSWTAGDCVQGGREASYVPVIALLLRSGADSERRDRSGQTALIRAAAAGNSLLGRELIARRADVSIRDNRQRSAMTFALRWGQTGELTVALTKAGARLNLVEALLLRSEADAKSVVATADLDARGCNGETALMLAARDGFPGIVRALLARKASPNVLDDHGGAALIYALGVEFIRYVPSNTETWVRRGDNRGDPAIVRALIAAGARPDTKNDQSDTALMLAAQLDAPDIAAALLRGGADPTVKNDRAMTALDFARMNESKA
ncbi:MAG TPA: ankyrin repeat domain-containing protein, partial [Chthonomonadaceae bacterium]|nr:ankyrin repeat domain-containing protein [Chthonomonadaceae bacterium]